jgi:hypothetical protein
MLTPAADTVLLGNVIDADRNLTHDYCLPGGFS